MKKLLFTSLLALGLLLPTSLSASVSTAASSTEFSVKKNKSKKSRKVKRSGSSKSYSRNQGCTYNGYELNVGRRGGCYYYSGNSKVYVDRSYCSGCN